MSPYNSCIYSGTVVHKRLVPRRHGFAYRVFALCLDLDEIDRIDQQLRLFSRNRRNAVSFHDGDVGDVGGGSAAEKARRLLATAGLARFGERIELVCYPRILGYVFNPLSVYFCRGADGSVGAMIYEVSNTFGERRSYVVGVGHDPASTLAHSCAKELYVSPFTAARGTYSFHVVPPGDRVVVGVAFREGGQGILKTHFRGDRIALTDRAIANMLLRHPLMTLKVAGAIHFEAMRLWGKGVPLAPRFDSPAYAFTIVPTNTQDAEHA